MTTLESQILSRRSADDLDDLVDRALREDLGGDPLTPALDITTRWVVGSDPPARARILSRQRGVVAGLDLACRVFQRLDPALEVVRRAADGDAVDPDRTLLRLAGSAAAILTGERTALNFLQHLSGVATLTRAFVDAVAGTGARITDTRKTTAGLRALEKAAVRCGGGVNHRFGLYDAVLIKENHVTAAGSVEEAVRRARRGATLEGRADTPVMCEAETVDQVRALVESGDDAMPDRILLDDMSLADLRRAVRLARAAAPRVQLEATGGVTLANARAIAETGVDLISIGALTHSAPALDLSLLFDSGPP